MDYWWVWSRQSTSVKLRTTTFSSEGLGGNSAKFCTSENFLLYSNFIDASNLSITCMTVQTCLFHGSNFVVCQSTMEAAKMVSLKNFPLYGMKTFYKNGSISISSAEAGMFRSKAVKTSGCSTPSLPTTSPLT